MPSKRGGRGGRLGLGGSRINSQGRGPTNIVEENMDRFHRERSRTPLSPPIYPNRGSRSARQGMSGRASTPRSRSPLSPPRNFMEQRFARLEENQTIMLNLIQQQQQIVLNQQQNQNRHLRRRTNINRTAQKNFLFKKIVNLNNRFSSTPKWQMLHEDLTTDEDMRENQIKKLRQEATNAALNILTDDLDRNLSLKTRKKQILHNIAMSLIQSYPVLASNIDIGENPNWIYVSSFFYIF